MHRRDRALWALAVLLSLALLMAPALWNGFPLLQWDTGGYLARWYEGYLVPSRAVVYGLILNAGSPLAFWPVLLLQSALTVWVIALMLRAHGLGRRPLLLLAVVATLSLATTLPWLTAILLTDIFCGLSVLALYLLLLRGDALSRGESAGLIVLIAVSSATHSATMAMLLGLVIVAALLALLNRTRMPPARLARGIGALALGAVMVFAADYAVAGRLAWTPGGFALTFGRMLQDGIVKKYLDEHCPDPALRLCAYKDQLPHDADVWFWGSDLFNKLGRFAGLGKEMETIAVGSVVDYPALQIETAAAAVAKQLVAVAHRRRRAQRDLAHLQHRRMLYAAARPRHARGAPAEGRTVVHRHQRLPISPRAAVDGPAADYHLARLPQNTSRPDRRTRRNRRARASRQRGRLRRLRQSARPLRRARGVACLGGSHPGFAPDDRAVSPAIVELFLACRVIVVRRIGAGDGGRYCISARVRRDGRSIKCFGVDAGERAHGARADGSGAVERLSLHLP